MKKHEVLNKRLEIEQEENWGDIIDKIPPLKFREEYEVKIIPPFGGAQVRFHIEKNGKRVCSVYCEFFDRLGCYGAPYYELYPFQDDIKRYALTETDEMMKDIHTIWTNIS